MISNGLHMSIQIPNLHTSNPTVVSILKGATVFIQSRQDAAHGGKFIVKGDLKFNPGLDTYPTGTLTIRVDLSDSAKGIFTVNTVEQLDTTGKHNPTAYATGRCSADVDYKAIGCRYWMMVAQNHSRVKGTPDVIGFLIYDRTGKRIAYGTGPVSEGVVSVKPNSE